jgi:hypothetical protein
MTETERRRHPRVPVDGPAEVSFDDETWTGTLRDVCRDAVLVDLPAPIPEGQSVRLTASLPGIGGRLEAVGTVVRIAPGLKEGLHGVALLFTEVTPGAATLIDLFLAGPTP